MPDELCSILDDKRQIVALRMDGYSIKREVGGLIQAYREPGEMSWVTWFAVWKERGGEPDLRVNGKYVQVVEY